MCFSYCTCILFGSLENMSTITRQCFSLHSLSIQWNHYPTELQPVFWSLKGDMSTNSSGFCSGVSCKSDMGVQISFTIATQLCGSPSASVRRRVAGFSTVKCFTLTAFQVMLHYISTIWPLTYVLFSVWGAEVTVCGTKLVSSLYPTVSLEALLVFQLLLQLLNT